MGRPGPRYEAGQHVDRVWIARICGQTASETGWAERKGAAASDLSASAFRQVPGELRRPRLGALRGAIGLPGQGRRDLVAHRRAAQDRGRLHRGPAWASPAEREATERRKANRESFADYGRRWLAERKSFSGQPLRADAQGLRADPRDSPRAHLGHAGRRGHHQRLRPAVARRLRQVEQARPDQGVRPAASDHEHGDRTS